MSFFKDFKDDFSQAMNELIPDNNEVYEDTLDDLEELEQLAKDSTSSKTTSRKKESANKKEKSPRNNRSKERQTPKTKVTKEKKNSSIDDDDIAPEDMLDQIDDILEKELYGEDAQLLPDDLEVNTMDMSVQDLLEQLSEKNDVIEEAIKEANEVDVLEDISSEAELLKEAAAVEQSMVADPLLEELMKEFEQQNAAKSDTKEEMESSQNATISDSEETVAEQLSIDDMLNQLTVENEENTSSLEENENVQSENGSVMQFESEQNQDVNNMIDDENDLLQESSDFADEQNELEKVQINNEMQTNSQDSLQASVEESIENEKVVDTQETSDDNSDLDELLASIAKTQDFPEDLNEQDDNILENVSDENEVDSSSSNPEDEKEVNSGLSNSEDEDNIQIDSEQTQMNDTVLEKQESEEQEQIEKNIDEPIEEEMIPTQDFIEDPMTDSNEMLKETTMSDEKDVISIKSVEAESVQSDEVENQKEVETAKATSAPKNFHIGDADTETTYITKGTTIKGDIETDGSIDIIGKVEGSVVCQGKIVVGGQVLGNITAGELYANNARIEGEVKSYGSVKVGVGSIIIGGIESESAVIAGAVNGDIDVKGPVIVDSTAVIMGNIKSRSVQINNGAVIEGFCSQSYSDIDVKSFFA